MSIKTPKRRNGKETEEEKYFEERQSNLRIKDFELLINQRIFISYLIPIFNIIWMIFVGVILLLDGYTENKFDISDSVAMTLLGTTTANILALFVIVAKYLFPSKK